MMQKFYSERSTLKSLETKVREQDALLRNKASSINTTRIPDKLIADKLTGLPDEYKQLSLNNTLYMCLELADDPRDFGVDFIVSSGYLANVDIYNSEVKLKYMSNGQWEIDNQTIHFVRIDHIDNRQHSVRSTLYNRKLR